MAEELGEKTEQPTAKKLADARKSGKTGKSADLSAAIIMISATAVLAIAGPRVLLGMLGVMRRGLHVGDGPPTLDVAVRELGLIGAEVARLATPLMLLMLVAAYLAQLVQVGFFLSPKPLEPNLDRLNVVKGFGRLFSRRSLVKGALDVVKLALVAVTTLVATSVEWPAIAALAGLPLIEGAIEAALIVGRVTAWVLVVLVLLGLVDFAYQRWQHTQDLKMTKHEVKDERKSLEGDPEMKARRMRAARQVAMQRLQADVPKADVIVTNPTHYAVAMRYDRDTMGAPRVVAKGADMLAIRIRQIAVFNGVPIVERPPLARALYAELKVGQEIREAHYQAVAEVLAYVYRLEGRAAS